MSTLTIGQKIRKARRDLDMTQEDLAKKLGVTKATINRYELGVVTNITRSKLEALAEALHVNPDEFFDYSVILNTYKQQLQNVNKELIDLSEQITADRYRKDIDDLTKRYESLSIKKNQLIGNINQFETLVKNEPEPKAEEPPAEEPTTDEPQPESKKRLVVKYRSEAIPDKPVSAGDSSRIVFQSYDSRFTPIMATAEEKELLDLYNKLPVRKRMQLLETAYSLNGHE